MGDIGVPPTGTLDPKILIWCEEHDFILVTNNRRSMPNHLRDHLEQGRHIPGIIELNPTTKGVLGVPVQRLNRWANTK